MGQQPARRASLDVDPLASAASMTMMPPTTLPALNAMAAAMPQAQDPRTLGLMPGGGGGGAAGMLATVGGGAGAATLPSLGSQSNSHSGTPAPKGKDAADAQVCASVLTLLV